jgi:hypothetical protein
VAVTLVTLAQWADFHLADHIPGWRAFTTTIASAPTLILPLMGATLGATAVYLGWRTDTPVRRIAAQR